MHMLTFCLLLCSVVSNLVLLHPLYLSSISKFSRIFWPKILYAFLSSRACCMPSPSHPWFTVSSEEYKLQGSSLCNFLHPHVKSPPLPSSGQRITLGNVSAITLKLCNWHHVRDEFQTHAKTTGIVFVICLLIFPYF